jgi:CrcB protein
VDERTPAFDPHGLPVDSDLGADDARGPAFSSPSRSSSPSDSGRPDTPSRSPRPAHLRWSLIALVALGGAVGTAAREALTLAFPVQTSAADGTLGSVLPGLPLTVGVINVGGAFLLGPDVGRRRTLRLTFGTGVLGGFTTYSALAADTAGLLTSGSTAQQLTGAAYAIGSIVIGGLASALGMWVGGRRAPLSNGRAPDPAAGRRPAPNRDRAGDS